MTTGCKNGMYGRDCITQCSGNCLHDVSCNSTNGHCDSGCASGYLDAFCNKSKYFRKLQETDNNTYYSTLGCLDLTLLIKFHADK